MPSQYRSHLIRFPGPPHSIPMSTTANDYRNNYRNGYVAYDRFDLTSCFLEKPYQIIECAYNILRMGCSGLMVYIRHGIATDHINFLRNGERCVEAFLSLTLELHKLLQNNLASCHYVTMLYSQKKYISAYAISK